MLQLVALVLLLPVVLASQGFQSALNSRRQMTAETASADGADQFTCGTRKWTYMEPACEDDFYGCYAHGDRDQILREGPKASKIPCGFHRSSAMDKLATQLQGQLRGCRTLIYTANFGAQGLIRLPEATTFSTRELGNICYAVILDEQSERRLQKGAANGWRMFTVRGEMPYSSAAHSYKVIKILMGRMLPPSVQQTLFLDVPVLHASNTWSVILDDLVRFRDSPITTFVHPRTDNMRLELANAEMRIRRYRTFVAEQEQRPLHEQRRDYLSRGYRRGKSRQTQTNILFRSYSPAHRGCALLLECAWFSELDRFSYRDQPSFTFVADALDLWPHVDARPQAEKVNLVTDGGEVPARVFRGIIAIDPPYVYDGVDFDSLPGGPERVRPIQPDGLPVDSAAVQHP